MTGCRTGARPLFEAVFTELSDDIMHHNNKVSNQLHMAPTWPFCTKFAIAWWRHQMETFSALLVTGNHLPWYWSSLLGKFLSPLDSPNKGQWRGALVFSLICAWINGRAYNRDADDLRCYRAHYDVTVMAGNCRDKLGYSYFSIKVTFRDIHESEAKLLNLTT